MAFRPTFYFHAKERKKCFLFNWPTSSVEIKQLYDGGSLLLLLSSWEDVKLRPFIITGIVCAFRGFKFYLFYFFYLNQLSTE